MGRGRRFIREKKKGFKGLVYIFGITFIIMFVTFIITYLVYSKKLKNSTNEYLGSKQFSNLIPNLEVDEFESTSTEIGKKVEEVMKEAEDIEKESKEMFNNNSQDEVLEENIEEVSENIVQNEEKVVETETLDPEFIIPIEGEKFRDYSKENLIYSNTLEEWVTHLGIDIKAERASVVIASESGKVVAIKNDPRYGLTIIIEHTNGFKTVYSNLLSTEFVKEGEDVEKGEAIGTVGNSASFEIADEPHLHFEILKDNENLDPNIYIY